MQNENRFCMFTATTPHLYEKQAVFSVYFYKYVTLTLNTNGIP